MNDLLLQFSPVFQPAWGRYLGGHLPPTAPRQPALRTVFVAVGLDSVGKMAIASDGASGGERAARNREALFR